MQKYLPLLLMILFYACGPSTKETQAPSAKQGKPAKTVEQDTWSKIYGGAGEDIIYTIQPVSDGYILAGKTTSFGKGNADILVMKINKNGALQWTKTFGGLGYEDILAATETMDGGYLLTGEAEQDIIVLKLNKNGLMEWNKSISAPKWEFGTLVRQESDSNYTIIGATQSFNAQGFDIMFVPLDQRGEMGSPKKFKDKHDEIPLTYTTAEVGPLLTGVVRTPKNDQVYLMQLTGSGQSLFTRTYAPAQLIAARLSVLPEDQALKEKGTDDYNWFLLLDHTGNKLKERFYAFSDKKFDASGTALAPDKGYIVAGTVNESKPALAKLSRWNEEIESFKELDLGYSKAFQPLLITLPDTSYILLSHVSNDGKDWDVFIAKMDKDLNMDQIKKPEKAELSGVEETLVQNYSARDLAPYDMKSKRNYLDGIFKMKGQFLYEFFEF